MVSALPRSPCDAPSFSPLRFSEAGSASIGRVPEHSPHRRSFPSLVAAAGRDLLLVELTRDGANAESCARVPIKDCAHDFRFCFDALVIRGCRVSFLHVAVAVRRTAKHIDRALLGTMPFAAPRALRNLRSFVLSNHAWELDQQLIFCCGCGRRLQEDELDSVSRELLSQQNLIGIFAAQPVRRVDQYGGDLACRRQIPHGFQARPQQRSATIAFVLKLPLGRNCVSVRFRVLDQSCGLALDGVILFLLIRRDACVNGCRFLHASSPENRVWATAGQGPRLRRLERAWDPVSDRTDIRNEACAAYGLAAGQPRLRPRSSITVNARLTMSLNVSRVRAA